MPNPETTCFGETIWRNESGQIHREGGPAYIGPESISWMRNGKYHREDGPAAEWADGTKRYYINGLLHREDGPAIEKLDGHKEWMRNGKRHRIDGPAVIRSTGHEEWYVDGNQVLPFQGIYQEKTAVTVTLTVIYNQENKEKPDPKECKEELEKLLKKALESSQDSKFNIENFDIENFVFD